MLFSRTRDAETDLVERLELKPLAPPCESRLLPLGERSRGPQSTKLCYHVSFRETSRETQGVRALSHSTLHRAETLHTFHSAVLQLRSCMIILRHPETNSEKLRHAAHETYADRKKREQGFAEGTRAVFGQPAERQACKKPECRNPTGTKGQGSLKKI